MIVTLWIGSACGRRTVKSACPASWIAVTRFSASLMIIERRSDHIRPVGCRDKNHAFVRLEAVHLHEELIERLLALVVPAAESGSTVSADSVDLVDEHDAGRVLLPLLEQIADARRADADEH